MSVPAAEAAESRAEHAALDRLRATDDYKRLKAERESLKEKLKVARTSGTPQQRLDASHDFVAADQAMKSMESAAILGDPTVIAAQKALAEIRLMEANDPVQKGVREGRIVIGMTEAQARAALEKSFASATSKGLSFIDTATSTREDGVKVVRWSCYAKSLYGGGPGYGAPFRTVVVALRDGKVVRVDDDRPPSDATATGTPRSTGSGRSGQR